MEKWKKEKRIMDRIDKLTLAIEKAERDLLDLRSQVFGLTDLDCY